MPTHPFTIALMQWFATHRRQMPWRGVGDPYAVWLSEVILQQTRVQQGWAYWERFMQRFPTVELLAQATEDEVLRLWQGLGYYSRARHLHAAAKQVAALGHFPDTYEAIRRLPGVGDYTAAAIASLAFNLPHPALDGNAYRVLARHFGIALPIHTGEARRTFLALAKELLPQDRAGDFNLAMMDFGSLQCTPAPPQCALCPLVESCVAAREGRVGELPVRPKPLPKRTRQFHYVYIRCQGCVALRQRGPGDIWQGLWELPQPDTLPPDTLIIASGVRHVLTHQVIEASLSLWMPRERPPLPEGCIWVREQDIGLYALPRLVEKLLERLPQRSMADGTTPNSALKQLRK